MEKYADFPQGAGKQAEPLYSNDGGHGELQTLQMGLEFGVGPSQGPQDTYSGIGNGDLDSFPIRKKLGDCNPPNWRGRVLDDVTSKLR
jgi:hypothetical protein